jgi:hypothetical protein
MAHHRQIGPVRLRFVEVFLYCQIVTFTNKNYLQ